MKCAEPTCSKEMYPWAWSRSAPQSARHGVAGKCPKHGRWVWCNKHQGYGRGCPVCDADARQKREQEAEQERRRQEEAEAARQREIAEVPLEERARRAAEEKKQEQVAQWQARLRQLRDDIVPHAIAIVQGRLGVTTSADDWTINAAAAFDFDSNNEYVTLELDGVGIRVQRTLEVNYDRPSANSDSYCSDYFYRGWIWNRARREYEQLSLATFGEVQQANKAAEREKEEKANEQA